MSVLVEKFDSRLVEREFETFYYSRIKKITTAGLVALSFYMAQDFFLNRDVFFSLLIPCILTLSVFYLCLIGAKKKLGPPDSLFLLFILSALGLTYTGIMFYENSYRIYTQTLIMLAFIFVPAGTGTILIGALFNILGTTFLALFVTPELFDQFEKVHIFI
ncbi:MAG: hypothetical protein ACE5FU_02620, partial [Nitrospinota bacterium]